MWVHGIRPHGDLRYIPFDRFNSWIYQTSNIKVDRFGVKTIEIGVTFDNPFLLICGKICSHHMENTSYGKYIIWKLHNMEITSYGKIHHIILATAENQNDVAYREII